MYRAYRFRLYPTTNQVELIHKTFGCARLVYNHYLEKQKVLYEEEKVVLSCFDMIKDLKNLQLELLLKDGIKDKENILSLRENTTLKEVIEQTV